MSDAPKLLPCPFCGGSARFDRMGTHRQSCIVECGYCGVRHESSDEFERSGLSWNYRADDARIAALTDERDQYADRVAVMAGKEFELRAALAEMEQRKDDAYLERNQCVALIARMALALGCKAGVAKTAIEGWSDDWHGCVYIDLPTGQVSWHFHDSQAHLFADLPAYSGAWDGHDTPEKYRRVSAAWAKARALTEQKT